MHTQLIKGPRGFGFNIVGGSRPRELLQVYSVTASGPSALQTGKNTINHIFFLSSIFATSNILKTERFSVMHSKCISQ